MTTSSSLMKLQTAQNKDSYLTNVGNFLFRNNVPEYEVTNFAPGSFAFKQSLSKTFLESRASIDHGISFGFQPDNNYVSALLRSYATNISGQEYRNDNTSLVGSVEGQLLSHYSAREAFAYAEFTKADPTLSKFELSKIVSILVKALTASERYYQNKSVRIGSFRENDPLLQKGLFRRLINIYEAVPGHLYCLSLLSYLGSDPSMGTIKHYWFNKHVIDSGIKTRELCPIYLAGGLPYFAGNMMWRQLGLKINPLGYITLSLSVEGSIFEVKNPRLNFDLMGNLGFQYISPVHATASYSNIFRPSTSKTLDYSCFGLPYEADILKYATEASRTANFPNLLKICYFGFGRYSNGRKRETLQKLQSTVYSALLDSTSQNLANEIRQVSSNAKRKAILEDRFQSEVELKEVPFSNMTSVRQSEVISRGSFYDKLVFAKD